VPANIAEGSSRESKKDYLHFLYIARGSLSETQYFIHLSKRLGYLDDIDAERLESHTKRTFACLHGLVRAVEKEAGKMSKIIATATSLLVLGLGRWLVAGPVVP
jgi:23S rRNA-intervening sequence protein